MYVLQYCYIYFLFYNVYTLVGYFFFFQAEDGIRDRTVTGVKTCALPIFAHWGAQVILPYGSKKPHLVPRHLVRMLAGPPVDLSAYAGQPLDREVLRAATAAVMADITGLLAQLRGEPAPAVPFDPAAARRARRDPGGEAEPPGDGQSRKAAPA